MRPAMPTAAIGAPAGLGALTAAGLVRLTGVLGASPGAALAVAAATALALALAGLVRRRAGPLPRWLPALQPAPLLVLAAADPLSAALGEACAELSAGPAAAGHLLCALWTLSLLPAALPWVAGRVAPPLAGLLALAGGVLGWSAPLPGALAGVMALALASRAPHADGQAALSETRGALLRAAATLTVTASGVALHQLLRGGLDPTLGGAGTLGGAAVLAAGLARPLALRSGAPLASGAAVAIGAAAALTVGLLGGALPPLGAGLVTQRELATLLLLSAPMAAAGAGIGAAVGLTWSPGWSGWAALGLGLLLGGRGPDDATLWIAGALGGAAALASTRPRGIAAGLCLVAAAFAAGLMRSSMDPEVVGHFRHLRAGPAAERDARERARLPAVWSARTPSGTGAVRATDDGRRVTAELDGLLHRSTGAAADAERFAGHLLGLLAPDLEDALLLGDETGRAMIALSYHRRGLVTAATPIADQIRAIARRDGAARDAWLSPTVRLTVAHPALLLHTTKTTGAVLEISAAPWADAFHASLDEAHLRAVARRLRPDGVLVLVLHLPWWEEGAPQAAAATVARHLPHVQLWLPPSDADTLIIAASAKPLSLDRLADRLPAARADLRELGLSGSAQEGLAEVAGLAVGDAETVSAWARGAVTPRGDRLGPALDDRPALHLASLAEHAAPPARTWGLPEDDPRLPTLTAATERRQTFLSLLARAAAGEMGEVMATARELSADPSGVRALDSLIEPHLAQAWKELERGRREGPSSAAWGEAIRFAGTAQAISPRSPRPWVLQGQIALAQGQIAQAGRLFEEADELDPSHLPALLGRAQAALARGDRVRAETYLRTATQRHPREWLVWQNLGKLLVDNGRTDEAEEALRRALTLSDGEQIAPHLALVESYLLSGQATRAYTEAERALRMEQNAATHYFRGRALFDLGEYERAEGDFQRALLEDPGMIAALGAVGHIRAILGDLEGARAAWQAVLAIDPRSQQARENLRRLGERSGPPEAPATPEAPGELR